MAYVVVIVILLLVGGVPVVWDALQMIASAFMSMFVAILPFLDIEQPIMCKVVTIVIVQVLCGSGFFISHKTESTIFKIVSISADIIATMLLLIA